MKLPALQEAWFAAPENGGINSFAERYRAKFGSDPTRIATLSYDAVSLAPAALARTQGSLRFSETVLTNHSGFIGLTVCSASAQMVKTSAAWRCCRSTMAARRL